MKLHVVGDSISIQYGPFLEECLKGVMAYSRKEGLAAALQNLDRAQGANGGDSARVLAYLQEARNAGGLDADFLLVNCGLHDIRTDPATGRKQAPIETYRDNLRAIVETARGMKPRLIWIRTTPCHEKVHNREGMAFHRFAADCEAYNSEADRVMAEAGVPAIDLHRFTLNLGEPLYCDHVHFLEPVRKQQAAFIAGWLAGFVAGSAHGQTNPAA